MSEEITVAEPEVFLHDPKGRKLINVLRISAVKRARQDMRTLTGLEDSIADIGQINPVVLGSDPLPDGTFPLLAGERRWRSFLNLLASARGAKGVKPGLIAFVFEPEADDYFRKRVEFDENMHREPFSMVEQAEITAELDELMKKRHGEAARGSEAGWSDKKTAESRGVSPALVSRQKKLVEAFKRDPKLRDEVVKRQMPLNAALTLAEHRKETAEHSAAVASGSLTLSSDLLHGDALKLIADVDSDSVSLILTDPPFGNAQIASESGESRGSTQSYLGNLEPSDNSTPEQVAELFLGLAPHFWRVLKPGCHFYIFYAIDYRQIIVKALRTAGLTVIPPDLIWNKTRNMNAFGGYNYMSCYEPVIYGYRPDGGSRRRLAEPMKNIIDCPPVPAEAKIHGFQKPRDLLQTFIRQSTQPGELVLDPFAGSGATIAAARELGRSGLGFELSLKNFTAGQRFLSTPPTPVL